MFLTSSCLTRMSKIKKIKLHKERTNKMFDRHHPFTPKYKVYYEDPKKFFRDINSMFLKNNGIYIVQSPYHVGCLAENNINSFFTFCSDKKLMARLSKLPLLKKKMKYVPLHIFTSNPRIHKHAKIVGVYKRPAELDIKASNKSCQVFIPRVSLLVAEVTEPQDLGMIFNAASVFNMKEIVATNCCDLYHTNVILNANTAMHLIPHAVPRNFSDALGCFPATNTIYILDYKLENEAYALTNSVPLTDINWGEEDAVLMVKPKFTMTNLQQIKDQNINFKFVHIPYYFRKAHPNIGIMTSVAVAIIGAAQANYTARVQLKNMDALKEVESEVEEEDYDKYNLEEEVE